MSITFSCESCGRRYQVDDALAGKKGKCKACGQPILIPAVGEAVPAAPGPTNPEPPRSQPTKPKQTPRNAEAPAPAPANPARDEQGRPGRRRLIAAGVAAGLLVLAGFAAVKVLLPSSGEGKPADQQAAAPVPPRTPGSDPQAQPQPAATAAKDTAKAVPPRATPAQPPTQAPIAPVVEAGPIGEIRQFEGHTDVVASVAFSPDGQRAISGGDSTVRLWDLESGKEVRRYEVLPGPVKFVAFAPDGRHILSGSGDHKLRLWHTETGQMVKLFEGHTNQINRLAIAPDGHRAASTSWDQTLRVWDLDSGREVHRIDFGGPTTGVAYSPDGRTILVTSGDHTARLLEADSARELRRFEGYTDWVGEAAFAPDGRTIATGGGVPGAALRLWDVEGREELRRIAPGPDAGWSIAFTPDSRRILVVEFDQVVLLDVATGRELKRYKGHSGQVDCVRISPDGRRFLSAGHDKTVRLWGLPAPEPGAVVANNAIAPEQPAPAPEPAAPAAVKPPMPAAPEVPPTDLLAKAAEARRQLDADENGDNGALQPAFNAALRAAAPVLTEVAVGTDEQPAQFTRILLNNQRLGFDAIRFKAPANGPRRDMKWEFIMPAVDNKRGRAMEAWYMMPLTGEMIGFDGYLLGKDRPVEGVDLPKKYHVVQELKNAQIRPGVEYLIWFSFEPNAPAVPTYVKINLVPPTFDVRARIEATESALKRSIELPESAYALGASPDGRRILMAAGSTLSSGDMETGQIQKLWEGPAGNVRTAAFSADGKLAAVGCGDGKVLLVDVDAGKELRACEGHSGALRCLAFLPNGKQFVSGGEDRTARLWDVATGKHLRTFEGHNDQVLCLAVSPDGRRFATGPSIEDKVARVWDLATGKLVAQLEGNEAAVYALAFSPDGKRVLTGGEDTTLRLYDAASGRPIRRFKPDNGSRIHSLLFLSNGRQVVAGSEGTLLTFWSTPTGRYLHSYEGPYSGTQVLAPATGDRFLSGCGDNTVRIWSLPPAATELAKARPTKADLTYLRQVIDDLATTTLEELGDSEQIDLNDRADDAGLAHLARLKNLERLSITRAPNVGGAGLKHLKGLTRLRSLDLSQTSVGNAGLAFIADMPRLETLRLTGTKVTSAGIPQLKSLKNLKELHLQDTAVDDAAFPTLAELPNLELLNLAETNVDGSRLGLVRKLKKLRTLYLNDTKVSEAAVEELRKARPVLEIGK